MGHLGGIWNLLSRFSRFEEAEKAFAQALEFCPLPNQGEVFLLLGNLNERRGNYLEAENWYLKAIEASPEIIRFRIFLGVLTFKRGDLQLAKKQQREAIECGGEIMEEAYFNLGGVLMAQERYEEAQACYQRALELDPEYKFAKVRLRDVKRILRNKNTKLG